jgi:TATA-binding protein-associated factor
LTKADQHRSLQRFKIDVASTVVNQNNAGLATMETDQILDLFSLGDVGAAAMPDANATGAADVEDSAVDATGEVRERGKKGLVDELGELWEDKQYEEEFALDSFLRTMKA